MPLAQLNLKAVPCGWRATFEGRRIAEIDRAVVRKWIAEMSAAGYAPKSMHQAGSVLSIIMQLAQESGAVLSNPA